MAENPKRNLPVGAEVQPGGVHFRVWAPGAKELLVHAVDRAFALEFEADGYFSGVGAGLKAGDRYGIEVDNCGQPLPDPATRSQPDGPHGLSEIIDPSAFPWTDQDWRGPEATSQILYEMHVGTFTPQGDWRAAADKLPLLAEIGITIIEMMPVASFVGEWGWGYDGVCWFAPWHKYGRPDDLRSFVDRAHALGVAVILDVVYNHFGPNGNYLSAFSPDYATDKYSNDWGKALNFDGPGCLPVREYVRENAAYWIREFHFDGLRLDATQQIFDASREHIVAELTEYARAAAPERQIFVIGENEPQDSNHIRPREEGGYGLDGLWCDDFHHTARVALTGRAEAYYSDYDGNSRELAAAFKYGFLYQGQRSNWQSKRRGQSFLDVDSTRRINFLENHDQVANSGAGLRLAQLSDAASIRAATAYVILSPGSPLLFQGQEFGSERPFLYFADLGADLNEPVAEGRRKFLSQFPSLQSVKLAAPHDPETFSQSVLDWSERDRRPHIVALHRDLIAMKRRDPIISRNGEHGLDIALLSDHAFLARFRDPGGADRLLILNFGADLSPRITPEPLLAPPRNRRWKQIWSSEDPAYGGGGIRTTESDSGVWRFAGHAAVLLTAEPFQQKD